MVILGCSSKAKGHFPGYPPNPQLNIIIHDAGMISLSVVGYLPIIARGFCLDMPYQHLYFLFRPMHLIGTIIHIYVGPYSWRHKCVLGTIPTCAFCPKLY